MSWESRRSPLPRSQNSASRLSRLDNGDDDEENGEDDDNDDGNDDSRPWNHWRTVHPGLLPRLLTSTHWMPMESVVTGGLMPLC